MLFYRKDKFDLLDLVYIGALVLIVSFFIKFFISSDENSQITRKQAFPEDLPFTKKLQDFDKSMFTRQWNDHEDEVSYELSNPSEYKLCGYDTETVVVFTFRKEYGNRLGGVTYVMNDINTQEDQDLRKCLKEKYNLNSLDYQFLNDNVIILDVDEGFYQIFYPPYFPILAKEAERMRNR